MNMQILPTSKNVTDVISNDKLVLSKPENELLRRDKKKRYNGIGK
jgi:hypothetical protein